MQQINEGYDANPNLSDEALEALRNISPPDEVVSPDVLRGLKDGDHECYRTVYLHWRKPIYTFVLNMTGNENEAEDVTQDIFTVLWQYKEKIDPYRNIRSLLYLLARRHVYNNFRLQQTREKYSRTVWFEDTDLFTSYDMVVEKEAELLKQAVLNRMPRQQREIFEMCNDKGMSADEVAAHLGIKKETVYSQLSKARKEIRDTVLLFLAVFATSLPASSVREILNSILNS